MIRLYKFLCLFLARTFYDEGSFQSHISDTLKILTNSGWKDYSKREGSKGLKFIPDDTNMEEHQKLMTFRGKTTPEGTPGACQPSLGPYQLGYLHSGDRLRVETR